MVIVFDANIYKKDPMRYNEILELGSGDSLAVTNPSFELFLLLHYDNSYEEIIKPNEMDILQNRKVGKRRRIAALFTEKSGMNPKENSAVGELAKDIDTAIWQEKLINQDIQNAIGNLTSNVAKIIQQIREDEALD